MANEKISQLTSGNPAQSDDLIPIARSGSNYSVTAGSVADLGGGSPGGSNGQLQGNDNGDFGGVPGSVCDFTNGLLTLAPPEGNSGSATLTIIGGALEGDLQDWFIYEGAEPIDYIDQYGNLYLGTGVGLYAALVDTVALTLTGALTDSNGSTGTSGWVLQSTGGAVIWAEGGGGSSDWSSLGNASSDLTLSNASYATTFEQTSDVVWLWKNTTVATSLTTNASPILQLQYNGWGGSSPASNSETWSLSAAPASAGANEPSTLAFSWAGSTTSSNGPYVQVPNLQFPSEHPNIDFDQNGFTLNITQQNGAFPCGAIYGSYNGPFGLTTYPEGLPVTFLSNFVSQTGNSCAAFGNISPLSATSGTLTGVLIGTGAGPGMDRGYSFVPSGDSTTDFYPFVIAPTIDSTGHNWSGASTMLLVNPTLTSIGTGSPTVKLLDLQIGGTSLFAVDTAGNVYANGTIGATEGPYSAITSIQTVGGIVTVLADVSDEALKNHSPYVGGLTEVLSINPIKYTWNEEGQKITKYDKDRTFVGFRAQDVQKAIPEAVTQSKSHPQYLGFDDRPIIAALVNAVKELSAKIDKLENAQRQ